MYLITEHLGMYRLISASVYCVKLMTWRSSANTEKIADIIQTHKNIYWRRLLLNPAINIAIDFIGGDNSNFRW